MNHSRVKFNNKLPQYPTDTTDAKLVCFVDAAYGNNQTKRRSITVYTLPHYRGAILYQSKAQSIMALSSTKEELIAAVTVAKNIKYVRSVMEELGVENTDRTHIYEDNQSAIKIINGNKPTGRSRHIDIQFFAIQDWKDAGIITMKHIPGIINPTDDLTKPLGYLLHSRHTRLYYGPPKIGEAPLSSNEIGINETIHEMGSCFSEENCSHKNRNRLSERPRIIY